MKIFYYFKIIYYNSEAKNIYLNGLKYYFLYYTIAYNIIIFGIHDIPVTMVTKNIDVMTVVYCKPWARIGAYLIGCLFGLGVFELKMKEKYPELKSTLFNLFFEKLRNSRFLSIASAVVGTGFTAIFVFAPKDCTNNKP